MFIQWRKEIKRFYSVEYLKYLKIKLEISFRCKAIDLKITYMQVFAGKPKSIVPCKLGFENYTPRT